MSTHVKAEHGPDGSRFYKHPDAKKRLADYRTRQDEKTQREESVPSVLDNAGKNNEDDDCSDLCDLFVQKDNSDLPVLE